MSRSPPASLVAALATLACGSPGPAPDLAILPIEVVAGQAGLAPVADSLRTGLACRLEMAGLRVLVRPANGTSAESGPPPERVGRQLGTTWVLWGSVFAGDESLRVVLHLAQAQDDRGAWVGTFAGARPGRESLEVEMARSVQGRIQVDHAAREHGTAAEQCGWGP